MRMADLEEEIKSSAIKLCDAGTALQQSKDTLIPSSCYKRWVKLSELHLTLSKTSPLIETRKKAWDVLKTLSEDANIVNREDNVVRYNGIDMDYFTSRHLSLVSYVTTTWSIYDCLANVCGRLGAIESIAFNPKQYPKFCEDFLAEGKNKKPFLGFTIHQHLIEAYSWPIKVSYKIRNWLVHEGYSDGDTDMFSDQQIDKGFRLHDDAIKHLESCCKSSQKVDKPSCCHEDPGFPWYNKNLLVILEKYHSEIDIMFIALMKWTTDTFVSQITAFAERDRESLEVSAAINQERTN